MLFSVSFSMCLWVSFSLASLSYLSRALLLACFSFSSDFFLAVTLLLRLGYSFASKSTISKSEEGDSVLSVVVLMIFFLVGASFCLKSTLLAVSPNMANLLAFCSLSGFLFLNPKKPYFLLLVPSSLDFRS